MFDIESTRLNGDEQLLKNQYGKLILLKNKYMHISIGPHYFICGFSLLLLYQFGLIILILYNIHSKAHHQIGIFLTIITPILYLLTAFTSPGIYNPIQCYKSKTKYCHICQHFRPIQIKHCNYCNICIIGYDHHCRWISKCIGKNNLYTFYGFITSLCSLNFFMYYSFYVIYWEDKINK